MTIPNLVPANPPIGIFRGFCMPQQIVLVLKEKVFSLNSDTYYIHDTNGQPVLQCQGKALSLTDRKMFADKNGHPLFTLRNKLFKILDHFHAEAPDGSGRDLFEVKGKMSFPGSKMVASFANAVDGSNAPVELMIKGNFIERKAEISRTDTGAVVAVITRQYMNMRDLVGADTYYVAVAAGVDLSLIAALCICFDERENKKN